MTRRPQASGERPASSWKDYGIRVDGRLADLVGNIVRHSGLVPGKQRLLRPPTLRVRRTEGGVNAYYRILYDQSALQLIVGGQLLDFMHQFTASAATYFLSASPGGSRPSDLWPNARAAVAASLEWASSPSRTPLFPDFRLAPRQASAARAFGDYAFRFAICHELAHAVLGHVDAGLSLPPGPSKENAAVYLASQDSEMAADSFGLELQLRSLPDPAHVVTAMASAVYLIYMLRLLEARLMLLGDLVDAMRWQVRLSHPPYLRRIVNLTQAAGRLHGPNAADGLQRIHEGLSDVAGLLWQEAIDHQEEAIRRVSELLTRDAGRMGGTDRGERGKRQLASGAPADAAVRELVAIFNESPIGVIRALDTACREDTSNGAECDAALLAARLLPELPEEFQRFWAASATERVDLILGS